MNCPKEEKGSGVDLPCGTVGSRTDRSTDYPRFIESISDFAGVEPLIVSLEDHGAFFEEIIRLIVVFSEIAIESFVEDFGRATYEVSMYHEMLLRGHLG